MMRICLVCETGLHILNCINYVVNTLPKEYPGKKVVKDLYIVNSNRIQDAWITNVKNSGFFDSVYVFTYPEYDLKRFIRPLKKLGRMICPKKYIDQNSTIGKAIYEISYDYIYMAYLTRLIYALSTAFPKARIRYFEDGLGTYMNSLDHLGFIKKNLPYWIHVTKSPWDHIDRLYVNNVEMCKCDEAGEVIRLSSLATADKDFLAELNQIFSYKKTDLYTRAKVVLLTQPFNQTKDNIETRDQIINIISKLDSCAVIRFHPSEKKRESVLHIDNTNSMWELVCAEEITEDHILVGEFSTAQLAPKICYNKEPWIIFTYKLFPNHFPKDVYSKTEVYINYLQEFYKDKGKICIPENVEGLEIFLKKALHKQ